jgi:hypothetical protein
MSVRRSRRTPLTRVDRGWGVGHPDDLQGALDRRIDHIQHRAGDDAQEVGFFDFDNLPPIAFLSHQALLRKEFGNYKK